MQRSLILLLWAMSLTLAAGVHAGDSALAAKVNGVGITVEKLDKTFDAYLRQKGINIQGIRDPEQFKELKRQVLEGLIAQELLWQAAEKEGMIASQEDVERVRDRIINGLPSKEAYVDKLRQSGFTVLRGESKTAGGLIRIAGVDDSPVSGATRTTGPGQPRSGSCFLLPRWGLPTSRWKWI